VTTWLDGPDYADSAAGDAEADLLAPPLCPTCKGSGEQHRLAAPPDPQTRVDVPCSRCGGEGFLDPERERAMWQEHLADLMVEHRREASW
jgi:DnaJ-class molecular chaperone